MGTPPDSQWLEGGEAFEVHSILDHRISRVRRGMHTVSEKQFLVRWVGYGPAEDRWVREENLNKGGPLHHWVEYMERFPDAFLSKVWATVQVATVGAAEHIC